MLLTEILFFLCCVIKFSITIKVTDPALPCSSNKDCSTNNAVCLENKCQCVEGYVYSGDKTRCLEVATSYGAACEESTQCSQFLYVGGTCESGFCSCASGYHYLHGQCWKSSSIGQQCLSSNNCYVNFDVGAAQCHEGICECSDGYYQREYRSCRRRAHAAGDDCAIDLDCQYDTNKNITCDKSRKCVFQISDTPLINSSANSESMDIDNEYEETEEINKDILLDSRGESRCPRGQFYSDDDQKCVPEIGEPCETHQEPLIRYSICYNNYWKCKVAFVPTKNNRACKKATLEYNKSCLLNEQCYLFGPDAKCDSHRCHCNSKSHFIHEESFCWANNKPGDKCQVNYDCYNDEPQIDSLCIDNVCTCPVGYHTNSKNYCVEDVKDIGNKCSETADCQPLPNTDCTNHVCSCIPNYYQESGQCVPGLNTPCENSTKCRPHNSYCAAGVCSCDDEFVEHSAGSCLPIAEHGKNCYDNVQCMALDPHSNCASENHVCSCADTYHYNYGRCFKRKVLGERCENIGECYVRSNPSTVVCKNGVCQCNMMKQVDDTYCESHGTTILLSTWVLLTITALKLLI